MTDFIQICSYASGERSLTFFAVDERNRPYGSLTATIEQIAEGESGPLLCGFVADLVMLPGAPRHCAVRMIAAAGLWMEEEKVPGVIIHVQGKNINRRFYTRLGFFPVYGLSLPGTKEHSGQMLMSCPVSVAMNVLRRFLTE
jgi:hypothetical protein